MYMRPHCNCGKTRRIGEEDVHEAPLQLRQNKEDRGGGGGCKGAPPSRSNCDDKAMVLRATGTTSGNSSCLMIGMEPCLSGPMPE